MIDGSPDGAYKRLEELGRGSFGKVYKVQHYATSKMFAMKIVSYAGMGDKLYRMQVSEIELLTSVRHPGIINYHEAYNDTEKSEFSIIMDIFTKGDLHSYINRKRMSGEVVSEATIWTVLAQLAYALEYCHSKTRLQGAEFGTVIHRDIKPENILVGDDGRVVFSDFGICRALEERNATATIVGTISYLAPEIAKCQPYSEGVDIWSLGCTIYEMCAKKLLFRAKNIHDLATQHSKFNISALSVQCYGYSATLEAVIKKMLQVDPNSRISSSEICTIGKVSMELKEFKERMRQHGEIIPQKMARPNAPQTPAKRIVSASPSPDIRKHRPSPSPSPQQGRPERGISKPASPIPNTPPANIRPPQPMHEASQVDALILAVRQSNVIEIRNLSQNVAKMTDSEGRTALMHAAILNNLEAVKILAPLESGLTDKNGHSALFHACSKKTPDKQIVAILGQTEGRVTNELGRTILMNLIKEGRKDVTNILVDKSYGVQDKVGTTALILAIRYGQTDIALQLAAKERGLVMKNGWTALMEAAQQGRVSIAKALKKAEAGRTGNMDWTALMVAAANGSEGVCRVLMDVECMRRDSLGETALMKAARAGKAACIQALIRREGKLVRPDGKSALMCAAEAGHLECVNLLSSVEAGLKKQDGHTALMFAIEKGHKQCAEILRPLEDTKCIREGRDRRKGQ